MGLLRRKPCIEEVESWAGGVQRSGSGSGQQLADVGWEEVGLSVRGQLLQMGVRLDNG